MEASAELSVSEKSFCSDWCERVNISHSTVVLFKSRAIVKRKNVFLHYSFWIQRGLMRIKHRATLTESLLKDGTPV